MKKLVLLAALGVFACKSTDEPADSAARASGRFAVQYYIVDKDTLWSANGINKINATDFIVEIKRLMTDSIMVIRGYQQIGQKGFCGSAITTRIRASSNGFVFGRKNYEDDLYEGTISGVDYYERMVGMNTDSLRKRLAYDSLRSPYIPPNQETIIVAKAIK